MLSISGIIHAPNTLMIFKNLFSTLAFSIVLLFFSYLANSAQLTGVLQENIIINYNGDYVVVDKNTRLTVKGCKGSVCFVNIVFKGKSFGMYSVKRKSLKLSINKGKNSSSSSVKTKLAYPKQNHKNHFHFNKKTNLRRRFGRNNMNFASPTCGCKRGSCRVSSKFNPRRKHPITGRMRPHRGMDIAGGEGTPIIAAEAGTVQFAGRRGGYGNTIIVDHGAGNSTLYAHLKKFAEGQGGFTKVRL